ncbi:MAG: polysaccharide deacetylase family protein [Gammaproteobacteria bacterium]|nr:polysaccharide deacetylase family protein [Gammaproteobacteria bacterium]
MIKQLVKRTLSTSAGWALSAPLRARGVSVLMYHRVTQPGELFPGTELGRFRAQMQWIKRNCTVINPDQVLEYAGNGSRTRPPVLITFDDGYRDYHDRAYPVLQELQMPALVFIATSFMDNGGMIWTDELPWAVATTKMASVAALPWDRSARFDLRQTGERNAYLRQSKRYLKDVADAERQRWLNQIFSELGVAGRQHELERQMLSWDEIRATMGLTYYGGHTHTHPIMSQLGSAELDSEIRICRDRMLAETGVAPRYFAYPNGRAADFNDESKVVLRKYGFDLAFTTVEGVNGRGANPMELRRMPTGAANLGDFAWLVSGRG